MFKRKQATKVDRDGRVYLANRQRRNGIPFTGFVFVMVSLWVAKALMLAQNPNGYYSTGDVVLDLQQPINSLQTLVFYPDPVTVWLADAIGTMLV